MARLRNVATGVIQALPCLARVGRGPDSVVRLAAPPASVDHARIEWTDRGWEVRDLGSTNGTFLGEMRLGAGGAAPLSRGARIVFGDPAETWEVGDVAPPEPMAWEPATRRLVEGRDGLLAIPDGEPPEVAVFRDREGRWVAEPRGRSARPVSGDDAVRAAGATWVLLLPGAIGPTAPSRTLDLDASELRIAVAEDGRVRSVAVVHASRTRSLDVRRHSDLLVVLARARLADAARPPAEQGWVDVGDLMEALRTDKAGIDMLVFRVREAFARAGVVPFGPVVQVSGMRRRLGIGKVEIVGA